MQGYPFFSENVLPPPVLGQCWHKAKGSDPDNAPPLTVRNTFLHFAANSHTRDGSLRRSLSEGQMGSGTCRPALGTRHPVVRVALLPALGQNSDDLGIECVRGHAGLHPTFSPPSSVSPSPSMLLSPGASPRGIPTCSPPAPRGIPTRSPSSSDAAPRAFEIIHPAPDAEHLPSEDIAVAPSVEKVAGADVVEVELATPKVKKQKKKKGSATSAHTRQSDVTSSHEFSAKEPDSHCGDVEKADVKADVVQKTTIMLRNLPLEFTRSIFLALLDSEGFARRYDFVYMPRNFETSGGFGYAFVNLVSEADAESARQHFQDFKSWSVQSEKRCETSWSEYQSLASNIERYRNSPVMHRNVPDEYKPVIFNDGAVAAFPAATGLLRTPKAVRRSGFHPCAKPSLRN